MGMGTCGPQRGGHLTTSIEAFLYFKMAAATHTLVERQHAEMHRLELLVNFFLHAYNTKGLPNLNRVNHMVSSHVMPK